MAAYNILEARNNLSRLVAMAESGAEVTIMRRGRPVARIIAAVDEQPGEDRRSGLAHWFERHPVTNGSGRSSEEIAAYLAELREARA